MPKVTIKALQAQIEQLNDQLHENARWRRQLQADLETQKKLVVARGLELEELRKDKIWLKQVVQNLTGDRHDLPH